MTLFMFNRWQTVFIGVLLQLRTPRLRSGGDLRGTAEPTHPCCCSGSGSVCLSLRERFGPSLGIHFTLNRWSSAGRSCLNLPREKVKRKVDQKRTDGRLLRRAKWSFKHLSYSDLGSP